MEISDVEQLVEMVRASTVGELTLKHEGQRITIRKAPPPGAHSGMALQMHGQDVFTSEYEEFEEDEEEEADAARANMRLVTSPLVGVFGHVKPFVGLNARVTEGQIMGVIEAMKIITEVKAPAAGTVMDVFIEDGHPVEFGQSLFEIQVD